MRTILIFLTFVTLVVGCESSEDHANVKEIKVLRMVQKGEYILVKANVHVCPFFNEYYTGYARVEESSVRLFGHEIAALDHSTEHVRKELIEAIGLETGRKPESLKIEVVKEREFAARQQEIDADIDLFHLVIAKCENELGRTTE